MKTNRCEEKRHWNPLFHCYSVEIYSWERFFRYSCLNNFLGTQPKLEIIEGILQDPVYSTSDVASKNVCMVRKSVWGVPFSEASDFSQRIILF